MLLLTSGCKLEVAQCKSHYYLAPPQSILTSKFCKPVFIIHDRVKAFKAYTGVQKQSASDQKVGITHA